jgi:hypothetical protein
MARLWQAWPNHRTTELYATLRWGAATETSRFWQDKSRKVRLVGTPAISTVLQTL